MGAAGERDERRARVVGDRPPEVEAWEPGPDPNIAALGIAADEDGAAAPAPSSSLA